jgi:hypothetical protein
MVFPKVFLKAFPKVLNVNTPALAALTRGLYIVLMVHCHRGTN